VFANCNSLWKLQRSRTGKMRMRVQPEPGPYRIWIPVRTASANRDRRIRHKSPCRGAHRAGLACLLFSFLFTSPLLSSSLPLLLSSPLLFSSFLVVFSLLYSWWHRTLSFYHHSQVNQTYLLKQVSIRNADISK